MSRNPAIVKGWLTALAITTVCATSVFCGWMRIGGPAWIAIILLQIGILAVGQAIIDDDL